MYFQFSCSSCNKKLKVREEKVGSKIRCPYCKTPILIEAPKETTPEFPVEEEGGGEFDFGNLNIDTSEKPIVEKPAVEKSAPMPAARAPKSKTSKAKESPAKTTTPATELPSAPEGNQAWSDSTEVGTLKSAIIGLIVAVVFYVPIGGIFLSQGSGYYIVDLFCDRGWVPFALVFLMGWSGAILFLKSQKLKRQKESMLFDLLPNDISERITAKSAQEFINHIRLLPVNPGESFLINRVIRGLEHFRILRNNSEVADRLASQSDIDANAVESSYTIIKVFIWAIPILGFIGTVIGIADAVGGFDKGMSEASSVEAMKDSLSNVTGGLSTAFDTTLIALVMSMFVMFPASAMQKAEEDLLNWVDEYCNENLLRRLKDTNRDIAASGISEAERKAMLTAVDSAMAGHHAELLTWSKKLEGIGKIITKDVTKGWETLEIGLQEKHSKNVQSLERIITSSQAQTDAATKLSEATLKAAKEQSEYFQTLQKGLESLNDVLTNLGGKQIIIETKPAYQPRKKRWGLF